MGFLTRFIGAVRTREKTVIERKIKQAEGQSGARAGKTTAPTEFDNIGYMQRGARADVIVRSGFFYEVRDAWRIYAEDDRVRSTIDSIGDDATEINRDGRPFNIAAVSKSGDEKAAEKVQEYLHGLFKRLKVYSRCSEIVKFALLEGTRFYRLVADLTANDIVELRYIKGPQEGYITIEITEGDYAGYYVQFEYPSQQPVAVFLPWEIVRFDWNRPDGRRYGMGLYSSARKNWKRLDATERDLYIARKTRAYPKISREYPNASIEELLQIRAQELEEQKKRGSMDVETDIYTTGKASVLEASNTALFNIADVEYAQKRLFASGRRPIALLGGYGRDAANRAILERQEHRYIRGFLSKIESMFNNGIESLVNTALILQGYLPQDFDVTLEWTRKSVEDKRVLAAIAKDGVDRMALPRSVYAQLFDLDPDAVQDEIEQDLERMAELADTYSVPILDMGMQPPK